jgi:hypothetical protein
MAGQWDDDVSLPRQVVYPVAYQKVAGIDVQRM